MENRKLRKENINQESAKIPKPFNNFKVSLLIYVFCSLTDRQRTKYLQNIFLMFRKIFTKKDQTIILNSSREINVSLFLHLCLLQADRQTDGQNIYQIDGHMCEESRQKKNIFLNMGSRK